MKILIDLQCCQTEAQSRGIGRYSLSLAREIARVGRQHDFVFLLNSWYLDKSRPLLASLEAFSRLGEIVYYDYPDVRRDYHERNLREQVANALRNDRIATICPDLYHISSLFEGESIHGPAAAFIDLPKPPLIRSATFYDFIPQLYEEHYMGDWRFKLWYKRTLGVAKQLDVGLTISEATKADARQLLRMSPDRLVNILGGVDGAFRPLEAAELAKHAVWKRIGRGSKFLFYVGGPDYRKNVAGLVEAFALANKTLKGEYSLVIVYDLDQKEIAALRKRAEALGVGALVSILGYVSDDELVALYNACHLFVFPSLYEGLGLPVVEAMFCGAPVLVGDNSSLREIVDDPRGRFDAASPADMAGAMVRVLEQEGELERMRAYSRARTELFTWERSARRALDAWEAIYADRAGRRPARAQSLPRIAMFTPLPDAKTGIADYSADFLAALAPLAEVEVFVESDADVTVALDGVAVWHHALFALKSDAYDVVIYQIGNSPYHHYMLPYLESYPGIVVVHDAYLGFLTYDPGNPEPFLCRAIEDHGGPARALIKSGKPGSTDRLAREVIDRFPCCAPAVYRSLGVIVHSQFAHDVIVAATRPATAPQITVLPQYRARPPRDLRPSKARARDTLKLPEDAFVVISLGHVSSTKGVLELVEAFRASKTGRSGKARLVLVGELEGGADHATPYARQVLQSLRGEEAGRGTGQEAEEETIAITGFVSKEDYETYLAAADLGIQLRTITRGETSRAMLDLLVNGVPFIFNRIGSSGELPADAAYAIDSFEAAAVAAAIDDLAGDPERRAAMSRAALAYASEVLDPQKLGSRFVEAALAMKARADACGPKVVSKTLARLLRDAPVSRDLVQDIAQAYVRQESAEAPPRVLIDVTHIREGDLKTGVQRVVRELTRAAYASSDPHLRPQAFGFGESGLFYADDYAQACGARAAVEARTVRSGPMRLQPLDKILMADGTWHLTDWMHDPVDELNRIGGSAYGLVHDLLPLQHPELFYDDVRVSVTRWLTLMVEKGAGLICTSQAGADALIAWIEAGDLEVRRGLRVGFARLGADIAREIDDKAKLQPATAAALASKNLFLMVGTIEPRKGHADVLDAFETLWASDLDVTLAFAGRIGWEMDQFAQRMERHAEAGKRFFNLGFVPEADIVRLYRGASATIMASIAEGFGLPIYEAAHFGAPLLLSDLPVFKELGGESARYFEAGSASALADAVRAHLEGSATISSNGIRPPTWEACATGVLDFMAGKGTYHRF